MNRQSQKGQDDRFDVIALVGSAGSHAAIVTLLRDLPSDFSVPIIVMQHLGLDATGTLSLYARAVPFTVEWVTSDSALASHTVLVGPPRSFVEVLPDGTFVVAPCERGALDKPMDRFLQSVARSFGERAIAVVLTGMGDDGAAGAAQLHLAGGYVLVQHEASAEQKEMPRAAIAAGAADLVAPLADLGQVLGEVAAGTPRPKARSELAAISRVFGEQGEVAARAREVDWAATLLGPAISWPEELRLLARTTLESASATAIWWGPELIQIYNNAWRDLLGVRKHPQALGRPARETWSELWHQIGPMVERVLARGEAVGGEDYLISIDRGDSVDEAFVTFSYAPIRDANGVIVGVQTTGWNTTRHVVAERRMRALRALATQAAGGSSPREACERAASALAADPADVPFALLYLVDEGRRQATLVGAAGVEAGATIAPRVISIAAQDAVWPLARVLGDTSAPQADSVLLQDLAERFGELASPPSSPAGMLPAHSAFLLPLRPATDGAVSGVLVAALSPHRPFDDDYRSFLLLVAQQIYAGIVEARARQLERERAERLAELDHAKTEFFANVSHEFRTPLTLMLAPLEDLLRHHDELPAALTQEIEVATNNARRLLRLVNSLLDFSQIETRRQHPNIKPTDLGELTTDIASAFRSAIEAAGLRFRVECDPKLPPVPVDRDMWEQIVSNLLANAVKFTFEGEIAVELRPLSLHAELVVKDTGIGIPAHELPNLFKRFHRVHGARARTVEGAGIGLAIVDDLVKRLGGQLRVRSTENRGSEFTIWLPYKSSRIASEPAAPGHAAETGAFASELAHEAARWLLDADQTPPDVIEELLGSATGLAMPSTEAERQGRIVVADDNADLREYLLRLLGPRWEVELTADGEAALKAAKRLRPDLILADVMMPGLDGFALLEHVRDDPQLKHTPVVLLTARAGEAAAIQSLLAGADDYIAKPFSPRELLARIQAAVERARAETALRASEARMRRAISVPKVGVLFFDLAGHINDANAAFQQMCGYTIDELRSTTHWEQLTAPEFHEETSQRARDLAEQGETPPYEKQMIRKDGTRWWGLFAPTRLGGSGAQSECVEFVTDITERKQVEEALRQSEARYHTLFDSIDEGFTIVEVMFDANETPVDYRFLEINRAFEQHTGIEDAAGRLMREIEPRHEAHWFEIYGRIALTGEPARFEAYAEYLNQRWFDVYAFRVEAPELRHVAILFTDITARKQVEAALQQANEELEMRVAQGWKPEDTR